MLVAHLALCFVLLMLLSFIAPSIITKTKAYFQGRIGPPLFQTFHNFAKSISKEEVISSEASWIFRTGCFFNLSIMITLSFLIPWLPFAPLIPGQDIFLVVYLLSLVRFVAIICSLDTGSPFSAFGASREAVLSLLTEPAVILALIALGLSAHSTNFNTIFNASPSQLADVPIWFLSATGLFIANLVELSRMPIDDPNTHLELTMVHEAMIIENSGTNLALVQLCYSMKLVLLYGLTANCIFKGTSILVPSIAEIGNILIPTLILALAGLTGIIESFLVKLAWKKNPDFIAYALTMSLLASFAALLKG